MYFDVNKDGKFVKDVPPSGIPMEISMHSQQEWDNASPFLNDKKKIIDHEIDVNDIPPSLLLMGIVNSHSSGMNWYITLDCTFEEFQYKAATNISKKYPHFPLHNIDDLIDMEYLDKHGKIKSTKQWIKGTISRNNLWIIEPDENSDGVKKALNHITGIVDCCRKFMEKRNIK